MILGSQSLKKSKSITMIIKTFLLIVLLLGHKYPTVEFNWYINESKLENEDKFTNITTKDNKGEDTEVYQ